MLIVLAAVNAVFIAWTTALEARHPAALARALGATPEQITTGLSVAFLPPALLGALLGIPGGIAIYDGARSGGGTTTLPSALWLVAMVILTLLVIAGSPPSQPASEHVDPSPRCSRRRQHDDCRKKCRSSRPYDDGSPGFSA